jgi:hypothetical protein
MTATTYEVTALDMAEQLTAVVGNHAGGPSRRLASRSRR